MKFINFLRKLFISDKVEKIPKLDSIEMEYIHKEEAPNDKKCICGGESKSGGLCYSCVVLISCG